MARKPKHPRRANAGFKGRRRPKAAPAQTLTLSISHIGARGDGVGEADGKQIFVPGTVPGDVVVAQVQRYPRRGPRV